MLLIEQNDHLLLQICTFLNSIEQDQYVKKIKILNSQSIGKHIRHIADFYSNLLNNKLNVINYDERERNEMVELCKLIAIETFTKIILQIETKQNSEELFVMSILNTTDANIPVMINTNFYRELLFVYEHAIHHLAIIKMAIVAEETNITLPENFGIAISTINYNKSTN